MAIIIANLLITMMSGFSLFEPNIYNSYALQAAGWLDGNLDLGKNYSHLEIAIFNEKYYVSFPPLPSILLLPFVLIFGVNTPDHIITLAMAVISGVFAYKWALIELGNKNKALFFSVFLCIGSNFLFLSNRGYVWFMAQTFAFTFTLLSFYYARCTGVTRCANNTQHADSKKRRPALALFFFCCAMGCRPLNAVFLPLLLYFLYKKDEPSTKTTSFIKNLLKSAIPAVLLGCVFMALNYFRFGNIFEFGHNYLPEFTESQYGQFSLHYLTDNFSNLWRLPWIENGKLHFYMFNGMAFWLVSPIVITYTITFIRKIITDKKLDPVLVAIAITIMLHLIITCTHKTMGGWHFGNRYTVDVLPIVYLGLLLQEKNKEKSMMIFSIPLLILGLWINIYGTVLLYS
jgi:4-amino-4-deoxy-L-arabinose transferase-like glycosyltransferase